MILTRKGYDDCFQSSLLLLGNKTPITVQRRELCKLFPVVVSSLVRSSAQHRISHVEEDGPLSNIVTEEKKVRALAQSNGSFPGIADQYYTAVRVI